LRMAIDIGYAVRFGTLAAPSGLVSLGWVG